MNLYELYVLQLRYDKYDPSTGTMSASVLAKYPLASDLSLRVRYSESARPIDLWSMSKGSTSLQNKTVALFGLSPKCLIINPVPDHDSTYVYAHNPYSNYVCFNIDDCPMYRDDLGHETWMDVATALWGGVSTKNGWPNIIVTAENDEDEMAPFRYLSDDAKTLLFMWGAESMISIKQIKTLMWEDTKYPGGTQHIYYYSDYPGTELGEEIVNKGIFLSLDLNKATMEPAKWRGPID